MTWVTTTTARRKLRVLLHGTADTDLPGTFTTSFGSALQAGGHDVTVELVPDATHHTLYTPGVIGARLVAWLRTLPQVSTTGLTRTG